MAQVLVLPVRSKSIIELIDEGKLEEARQEIGRLTTAAHRDGNLLYFQALLEPNGDTSYQFLEAAVRAGLDPEYLEDNTFLMARYFLAKGDFDKLMSTATAYLQRWENGKYRPQILRLAARAKVGLNQEERSQKYIASLIKENSGHLYGALGKVDDALRLYREKKYIEAQNICRRLANSSHDEAVVPALYMLSYYSIEQKRIDDAILYYNLLREGYPDAIGLDDLVDKFTRIERKSDPSAEDIAGMVYSVQTGVFAEKDNAERMADRMKEYGEKVEIKEKTISGKDYYVVYVGRFKTTQQALALKTRLEASANEAYQVVAR
jgi:tetratricopeptide (TPR) repeat protein